MKLPKIKNMLLLTAAMTMTGISSNASATTDYCFNETVNQVILHSDGNIYYTTSHTCHSWCKIDPTWNADMQDRAMSMLLTARTAGKTLSFQFSELTAGCAVVPVFSSPGLIMY